MASPLRKRFPRELKNNLGKYLGIFLLMSVTIALTSGFLLAAHSIGVIIDDMPEKYSIEDARFTTAFEATDEQLDAAADAANDAGTGGTRFDETWLELALMVRRGCLSAREAIRIGTAQSAACLGLTRETGAIGEGLSADLIALETDPITCIEALAHPARVMAQGRLV